MTELREQAIAGEQLNLMAPLIEEVAIVWSCDVDQIKTGKDETGFFLVSLKEDGEKPAKILLNPKYLQVFLSRPGTIAGLLTCQFPEKRLVKAGEKGEVYEVTVDTKLSLAVKHFLKEKSEVKTRVGGVEQTRSQFYLTKELAAKGIRARCPGVYLATDDLKVEKLILVEGNRAKDFFRNGKNRDRLDWFNQKRKTVLTVAKDLQKQGKIEGILEWGTRTG